MKTMVNDDTSVFSDDTIIVDTMKDYSSGNTIEHKDNAKCPEEWEGSHHRSVKQASKIPLTMEYYKLGLHRFLMPCVLETRVLLRNSAEGVW